MGLGSGGERRPIWGGGGEWGAIKAQSLKGERHCDGQRASTTLRRRRRREEEGAPHLKVTSGRHCVCVCAANEILKEDISLIKAHKGHP